MKALTALFAILALSFFILGQASPPTSDLDATTKTHDNQTMSPGNAKNGTSTPADKESPPAAAPTCQPNGFPCGVDTDCCHLSCNTGVCG